MPSKVKKRSKKSKKSLEDDLALLGNLTYLDMFPYRPAYEFNGFRTAFGAVCTLLFLFAITLNVMTEIGQYLVAPPIVKESYHLLSKYEESITIPVPQIGIRFREDGNKGFYNERYFKFVFLQGESTRGAAPILRDAGLMSCSIPDPDGLVNYPELKCPVSDMSMQGSDNSEYFRFSRVVVEQCVNWTKWDRTINDEVLHVGSTTSDGALCAPQTEIDAKLRAGTFTVLFMESDMRTDTDDEIILKWIRKTTKHALQNVHTMFTSYVQLKKIDTVTRYPFSSGDEQTNFLQQTSQEVALADLAETYNPCDTNLDCKEPHLYRLGFQWRLDSIYRKQIREPVSLYTLLEAFGGVTFFFLVIFGGAATYVNKSIFQQQTKGLDLRKLDASQFDKFGNLIDKSFQMPRELQDMTAE